MQKLKKKIIRILLLVIITYICISLVGVFVATQIIFGRNELKAYSIALVYSDIEVEKYPRETIEFYSNQVKLQGHIYGHDGDEKGVIIIAHGISGGADSHLQEIMKFVDANWCVFVFDGTGSRESGGWGIRGLPQTKLDLRKVLEYLNNREDLKDLPVCLYGHSMGGYAVTAVLDSNYDITAVVSVAGFNEPLGIIFQKMESYIGPIAYLEYPFMALYEYIIFGADANTTAIEGINKSNVPVLLIYGTDDKVVPHDEVGVWAYKHEITNPNVRFFERNTYYCNGHDTLWLSQAAGFYMAVKQDELNMLHIQYGQKIPHDVHQEFVNGVDKFKISELDEDYIKTVIDFFDDHRPK